MSRFAMRSTVAQFVVFGLFLAVALVFSVGTAQAEMISLSDGNSTLKLDSKLQQQIYDWTVDGTDVMNQQGWWYSIGSGPLNSLDTLSISHYTLSDTNNDTHSDTVTLPYQDTTAGLRVDLKYSLVGGSTGSLEADLATQIRITNLSTTPLDFHLYRFVDLNESVYPLGEIEFVSSSEARPTVAGQVMVYDVNTRSPQYRELGLAASELNSLSPVTLGNPLIGDGPAVAHTWAFQWDTTIAAGSSYTVSSDTLVTVPEPSTLALVFVGGLSLVGYGWRRRRATIGG